MGFEYAKKSFEKALAIQDLELMIPMAMSLCTAYASSEPNKITYIAPKIIDLLEKSERKNEFFGMPFNSYSYFCGVHGYTLGYLGNVEEGRTFCKKGLINAIEIDNLQTIGLSEFHHGVHYFTLGDGKNAIVHGQNAMKIFNETKISFGIGIACYLLGMGYYFIGEMEEARKNLEKGVKIYIDSGISAYLSMFYRDLVIIHAELGDLKNAQSCAKEAIHIAQKNNQMYFEGHSWIVHGMIHERGNVSSIEKAKENIFRGIKILEGLKLKPWIAVGYFYLGKLYIAADQKNEALVNLNKAERMFREMGMDYWLAMTHTAYADLSKYDGDISKAQEHLRNAIGIFRELCADGWVEKYEKELAEL
jgi:tetratricopeptide (TPR) repeat protein